MSLKPVSFSKMDEQTDDIYEAVVVMAQRSKQIIDDRVMPIEETEDVEDSIQLIEPVITHDNLDKPMVQALEEHLNGELEWRHHEEDELNTDES